MLFYRLCSTHQSYHLSYAFPRCNPANWFKFEELMASYTLELHALKAELQSSLARLGLEPASTSDEDTNLLASTSLATEAAVSASHGSSRSRRRRPITRWNRRQLTHELAAASERRRELEQQLQRDLQQDRDTSGQQEQRDRRSRRTRAYQAAIAELQQQRAEIRRQIEAETKADKDALAEMQAEQVDARTDVEVEPTQVPASSQPLVTLNSNESLSETHYSIGGVVTLEPVSSQLQTAVLGGSRTGLSMRPVAHVPAALPSVLEDYPRFRQPPDALNDVFSLQLKFAETMLKLEKSVQMRDQLLHHGGSTSLKRRNATHTREEESKTRRRNGRQLPHRRRTVSGSSSDSSVVLRESRHSESFSSSAYSFSSLDSTPCRGQTTRVRYPNFGTSRATTAETLAPSSAGGGSSPASATAGAAAPVSSSITTTTLSPEESPDTLGEAAPDRRAQGQDEHAVPSQFTQQHEEIHRTPTTGSSATTPTTGSDQKSNASSKQVRFGDGAYSTPMLARKFTFDNPSMDEDDEEEKDDESLSLLSFLGGSSVSSAELNDASFLRAFERFRRELNAAKHKSVMQSPVLARKLFAEAPSSDPLEQVDTMQATSGAAQLAELRIIDGQGQASEHPALDGMALPALQERRRQLCIDIQAESAQLVLNFGVSQNVAAGPHDAAATKDRLLALRDELKVVDKRIDEQV